MARGRPPRLPRAQQERELLEAARAVLDERGLQDAQVDDIARRAGISKGLVYRHFASKEELHMSAVLVYLDELGDILEAVTPSGDPVTDMLVATDAYLRYAIDHPAFVDCSLSLLRRSATELVEEVSPAVALRLGQAMARGVAAFRDLLDRACDAGLAEIDDRDLWVSYWYMRAFGSLHLTRTGVIISIDGSPLPTLRVLDDDELVRVALEDLLADAHVEDPQGRVAAWMAGTLQAPG